MLIRLLVDGQTVAQREVKTREWQHVHAALCALGALKAGWIASKHFPPDVRWGLAYGDVQATETGSGPRPRDPVQDGAPRASRAP